MDKRTRDEAVAWARDQLREVFRILAMIENDVTQEVSDILEHVEELDRLAKVDRSWVTEARKRRRIVEEELRRAFLAGLAPDGTERHSPSPYVRHLQEMAKKAPRDRICYDALCIHACKYIDDDPRMPHELKLFLERHLMRGLERRGRRGTAKVNPARDAILYELLRELIARYGVKGTRARDFPDSYSACDILADAMPRDPRLPKSYVALERILLAGDKAKQES